MADASTQLRRTPLHARHVGHGARMTPFGGWDMPLQYEGIIAEHVAVRTSAGLFDVSHMGELRVVGNEAVATVQRRLSNDLARLSPGMAQYTMLLADDGGIEEDLIAYRVADEELLLVVNAANRAHVVDLLGDAVEDVSDGWGMLALQGPHALDVLADVAGLDLRDVPPFRFTGVDLAGAAVIAATTGYTGERGCELLVPADGLVAVWDVLVADERVTPCGLGARDTLRLEACLPLHGSDIDASRDPISAGLGFAAPAGVAGGGAGHEVVDGIRERGPQQRLVPVLASDRGIPRGGATVRRDGVDVGVVTSGTMSPTLREGIALAWVDVDASEIGTELVLDVRGRPLPATVVKRPFVRGAHLR